jgi:hypothetical protein
MLIMYIYIYIYNHTYTGEEIEEGNDELNMNVILNFSTYTCVYMHMCISFYLYFHNIDKYICIYMYIYTYIYKFLCTK